MIKIRIHGRGGQGNVTAAELLAVAAFADGKFSQAFPAFGSERMGAPVVAFVKVDEERIRSRGPITDPDYIIVQDPTLIGTVDVLKGLKPDGVAIFNTERELGELGIDSGVRMITVPATAIAKGKTGRPVPNTALLGAFSAVSEAVSLGAIQTSIKGRFSAAVAEKNVEAASEAYRYVKEHR